MGIFSFIGSAGAKLFGGKKPSEIPNLNTLVQQHLKSFGLDSKHVHCWLEGEAMAVCGWVDSKADKEKIVLAVGNVEGVDKVIDRLVVGSPPVFKPKAAAAPIVAAAPAAAAVKLSAEQVIAEQIGAPLPTAAEAEKHAWESKTYTVEKGDTLGKIAKAMYGNAAKYPVIFEANKPMLKDPDKIYPGQVLRIPPLDAKK
jgi:nucleoid-associated protein YgaU